MSQQNRKCAVGTAGNDRHGSASNRPCRAARIHRCLRRDGSALVQFSLIDHADNRGEFVRWARAGDDEGVRSRFYTETEAQAMLELAGLHPQIRLYIPGEIALIVTPHDERLLGEMPLVRLSPARSK